MKAMLFWILLIGALSACRPHGHDDHHGHDHDEHGHEARGPHGGLVLNDGDLAVEVTIYERGVPPQFRLYAYRDGAPLAADQVEAELRLTRIDGDVDEFRFRADGDTLIGEGEVAEPHSFDVQLSARIGDREHRWQYPAYEGRVRIADAVAQEAGVETAIAGPATIRRSIELTGNIVVDPERRATVRAPYPGAIVDVRAALGERVAKGQPLAIVENRDSLRRYTVSAPIAGTLVQRYATVGDVADERALFEIADLRVVFVELRVFPQQAASVAAGQTLHVRDAFGSSATSTTMAPLAHVDGELQALIVRAPIENDGRWRLGAAVSATLDVGARVVPLAVERRALQQFRDMDVVYAQFGDQYEVRMLKLGDRDATHVEVLSGLKPGTRYATAQSYLIKADIEKSGASHDH